MFSWDFIFKEKMDSKCWSSYNFNPFIELIPVLSFPLPSIFSSGISMLLISRDELVDKMNSEARNCIFHQDITLTDPNIYSFFCKTLDRIILLQHFTLCSLQVNLFNPFHFLKNFSSRHSKSSKFP